ncbi:ring-infected erythrocyte surface antigen domain-containing protein [Rhizosphaericola mali]|uniref:Tetratricopeptide repeat protein n=1 Tax=Rhizosphaericola mali TaxID=2545455 RepID=A0A5P2G632_9BACT|nr:hypothetical protein [Rhizosphaericola mali]QES90747.1 hypothetical protein E0W69_019505 [Rhizosphaericola mali]
MSELENNIVTWLTGKPTLADVSVSQLENIVSQYPYFTIAQLLLTAKLKEQNHPGYNRQLQKTALNFQDPKWLFFQLNQLTELKKADTDLSNLAKEELFINNSTDTIETSPNLEIMESFVSNVLVDEEKPVITEENIPQKDIHAEKEKVKAFLKSVIDNPNTQLEEKNFENTWTAKEENIAPIETFEPIPTPTENEQTETFTESVDEYIAENDQPNIKIIENGNFISDTIEDSAAEEILNGEEDSISDNTAINGENNFTENMDEYIGEKDQPNIVDLSENIEEQRSVSPEFPDESVAPIEPIVENIAADTTVSESTTEAESNEAIVESNTEHEHSTSEVNETIEEEAITPEVEEENLIGEKMSAKLANIASSFKSEAVPKQLLLSEEATPAHVKDYFASIGVKVNNNIQSDFGQKVKKFTEWLKVMKKIGADGQLIQTSEKEELKVAQDAAKSNQNSDIVTEAMVDVLTKQGKKNEAIEILNRLSLLKPEKSAYFASQINDLNENK